VGTYTTVHEGKFHHFNPATYDQEFRAQIAEELITYFGNLMARDLEVFAQAEIGLKLAIAVVASGDHE